jgi:YbbR domain-containing protein
MAWRDFITENRWQKVGSLVLAVLIWLTVNADLDLQRLSLGGSPTARTFDGVPVGLLGGRDETNRYRLTPSTVTIEVHGRPDTLRFLRPEDLEVYVNVLETQGRTNFGRRIHVRAPGVQHADAMPEEVRVERVQ